MSVSDLNHLKSNLKRATIKINTHFIEKKRLVQNKINNNGKISAKHKLMANLQCIKRRDRGRCGVAEIAEML